MTAALIALVLVIGVLFGAGLALLTIRRRQLAADRWLEERTASRAVFFAVPDAPTRRRVRREGRR